jgi:hypothetical protein
MTSRHDSSRRLENENIGLTGLSTRYDMMDTKFTEGLDMVNIRVDEILRANIPKSPPNVNASMPTPDNMEPDSAPHGDGLQTAVDNEEMPCSEDPDRCSESCPECHKDRPNFPKDQEFRDTGGSASVRLRSSLDPRRSPREDGATGYQGSSRTPLTNPYHGSRDNRNDAAHSDPPREDGDRTREADRFNGYHGLSRTPPTNPHYGSRVNRTDAARSDPRQYDDHTPYDRRPPDVDVEYGSDDEDHLPQGGQIISPRHWDCRQLAQLTGHSPLDAAALGCREYHGYQRGYYPLTAAIIRRCGYKDAHGEVSPYCNEIILLHRKVLDAWDNRRTQQCGPSVDRILEKGLPVFPKLDSLDMLDTVNFYDKLQKTSALFLLPLMLFDAINLQMGFEGLCPPGLGLPRYAEIAGVLMEVLLRLLPSLDSQLTSVVTVVRAESNNGFNLLWRILELAVPGFDPSLQISAPVWLGDDIFDFCLSYVLYFRLQAKKGIAHDERTKSIMFLQAVRKPAYANVITTLQAHIDTFLSHQDYGYLPPNLCMMGLAVQMNKNARARVRDVLPRVARRLAWDQDGWHPSTPEIQGFHLPQVYRTETPRDRRMYDAGAGSCTPDQRNEGRDYGYGAQCPSLQEANRDSSCRPGHDGGIRF